MADFFYEGPDVNISGFASHLVSASVTQLYCHNTTAGIDNICMKDQDWIKVLLKQVVEGKGHWPMGIPLELFGLSLPAHCFMPGWEILLSFDFKDRRSFQILHPYIRSSCSLLYSLFLSRTRSLSPRLLFVNFYYFSELLDVTKYVTDISLLIPFSIMNQMLIFFPIVPSSLFLTLLIWFRFSLLLVLNKTLSRMYIKS